MTGIRLEGTGTAWEKGKVTVWEHHMNLIDTIFEFKICDFTQVSVSLRTVSLLAENSERNSN